LKREAVKLELSWQVLSEFDWRICYAATEVMDAREARASGFHNENRIVTT